MHWFAKILFLALIHSIFAERSTYISSKSSYMRRVRRPLRRQPSNRVKNTEPPEHPFLAEREKSPDSSESNEFDTRIAGGNEVLVGDTPYHLQLRYQDVYLCGAVLVISPHGNQVALTAGQCITQKKPSTKYLPKDKLTVVGGRIKRDGSHIFEQFRKVVHMGRHPDWRRKPVGLIHDIAVLHFDTPFDLNRMIFPIPLPTYTDVRPHGRLILSGWGYYHHSEKEYADRLQVSIVETEYQDKCNADNVWNGNVPKVSFCAGKYGNPNYQGACIGDEGGPAIALFNATFFVAGIYSWGSGAKKCGNRYKPSVYTCVSYYIRWILKAAFPPGNRKKRDVENQMANLTDHYRFDTDM